MNDKNKQEIPDRLLNEFGQNKRPEDKPFTYMSSGGIAELQQRQREVASAPKVKAKPRHTSGQGSYADSDTSQTSYDSAGLFTPAYLEMLKNQEEMRHQPLPSAVPADMVGYGPGKIPQEDVAAYILQPDGTMAALRQTNQPESGRWNDKLGPGLQNSAVFSALMEEQNAQVRGTTAGRIHSVNGQSGNRKQGLSFQVLQWLTGTESEDGSEAAYSGSHDGIRQRHSTSGSQYLQETIPEGDNTCHSELEYLYVGSRLPSKSFRNLLRSVSSTTASTDDVGSLPSPTQERDTAIHSSVRRSQHAADLNGTFTPETNTYSDGQRMQPKTEPCAYSDF